MFPLPSQPKKLSSQEYYTAMSMEILLARLHAPFSLPAVVQVESNATVFFCCTQYKRYQEIQHDRHIEITS